MRVLLAHKFFKYTGGADVFYLEAGRVLEENGHEVAYFSVSDEDNLQSSYAKFFPNSPQFKSSNPLKRFSSIFKISYNIEAKRKFTELINEFQPDVIHAFGIVTHLSPSIFDAAKALGIPIVWSLNDYKHICPNYKLFQHGKLCEKCKGGKFYNCITNKCSHDSIAYSVASAMESYIHQYLDIYKKNVDLFLFASDFMVIKTEEFWGSGTFKWAKLLNPFQIPSIVPEEAVGDYGLYFGRLIDEKGVDVLINALRLHPNLPFKIVGDGPDMELLKKLAIEYNLNNIEFTGPMWGEELNQVLYNCKFVVVPSIWHENFPYVILQAFAASKPVIGSNRGGIPELIKDGDRGFIYDASNSKELAEVISQLTNDDKLIRQFGDRAREYVVKNFNDEVFYSSLMSNYNKVISK